MADDPYDYDFVHVRDYILSRLRPSQLLPMFGRSRRDYPSMPYVTFAFWSDQGMVRTFRLFEQEAAKLEARLRADGEVMARLKWLTELGFDWNFGTSSEKAGGHWLSFYLHRNEAAERALAASNA